MANSGFLYAAGSKYISDLWLPFALLNLSSDSAPLSSSDTSSLGYTTPSIPIYGPFSLEEMNPSYLSDVYGTTITFTDPGSFSFLPNDGSTTIFAWWVSDPNVEFSVLFGGNLPIPYPVPAGGGNFQIYPLVISYGNCQAAPPAAPFLLLDLFDGSPTTSLTAHSPDLGGSWSYFGASSIAVGGGSARGIPFIPAGNIGFQDLGQSSYTLEADMVGPGTAGFPGLIARFNQSNGSGYDYVYAGGLNSAYLYELTSGVATLLLTFSVAVNTTHRFAMGVSGDTIACSIDGQLVGTYGSATQDTTSTLAGFVCFDQGTNPGSLLRMIAARP